MRPVNLVLSRVHRRRNFELFFDSFFELADLWWVLGRLGVVVVVVVRGAASCCVIAHPIDVLHS